MRVGFVEADAVANDDVELLMEAHRGGRSRGGDRLSRGRGRARLPTRVAPRLLFVSPPSSGERTGRRSGDTQDDESLGRIRERIDRRASRWARAGVSFKFMRMNPSRVSPLSRGSVPRTRGGRAHPPRDRAGARQRGVLRLHGGRGRRGRRAAHTRPRPCRGRARADPREGIERGGVLVHNHPSGVLDAVGGGPAGGGAALFEQGLGFAITDNDAGELYVVLEPPAVGREPADRRRRRGPTLGPRARSRSATRGTRTARSSGLRPHDRRTLQHGGVGIAEAGTGTGKSVAYLLPAIRWAVQNGSAPSVSTNTINLQEQLVTRTCRCCARRWASPSSSRW